MSSGTFEINEENGEITIHITVEKRINKNEVDLLKEKFVNYPMKVVQHRRLSLKQHNLIFALYTDLERNTGQPKEDFHKILLTKFLTNRDLPELSTSPYKNNAMDVQTANDYIDDILFYGISNGIPLVVVEGHGENRKVKKSYEVCKDIRQYQMACMINKTCAICGDNKEESKVTIHHVEHVNRLGGYEYDDASLKVMSVCAKCHSLLHSEAGLETEQYLENRYHMSGVYLSLHEAMLICSKKMYESHFSLFRKQYKNEIKQLKEMIENNTLV